MTDDHPSGDLGALLEYLHERRNFDSRGCKRGSLSRRIIKRMQMAGIDDFQRYTEVLEASPGEFAELFNTILINVTGLVRDPEAWDVLAQSIIPAVLEHKQTDEQIRIWSAGCASGEEAYTLAVLFAEALGEERFRHSVKIYATDVDSDALTAARHGRYRAADLLDAFGEERTHRFFELDGTDGVFRADLRRALIFGRHDLVRDPPISRIDLVTCRNTLMYFTGEVQGKILASFGFALNPGAYLFLGKAEALDTRRQMFDVVDPRQHIFRKDGSPAGSALLTSLSAGGQKVPRKTTGQLPGVVFENNLVAQVVLDASGVIVLANRAARLLLPIGSAELGRHLRDAEFSLRPADLRTPADRVLRGRRPVALYDVPWHGPAQEPVTLDITVSPLEGQGGALITFLDVSRYQHLRELLEQSRRELETAYEVLQPTVEELETINEEFQTANEEVETTNEELETISNELRERSAEVIELNQFQEAILGSLQSAVIVLGIEMEIRAWNRHAEELWGRRSDEVLGQHFLKLDIGFPVDRLRPAIRDILAGREEHGQITAPAVNRRGQPVDCTVNASCLAGRGGTRGVILMMHATLRDGTDGTAAASDQAGHATSGPRPAGAAGTV